MGVRLEDWSSNRIGPALRSCPDPVSGVRTPVPHVGPREGPAVGLPVAGAQTSAEAHGHHTGQVGAPLKTPMLIILASSYIS